MAQAKKQTVQRRNADLLKLIAVKLKALRNEKGVTQQEVFDETAVHIARLETAKVNISVSTLSELCAYFEISLADFFGSIESRS